MPGRRARTAPDRRGTLHPTCVNQDSISCRQPGGSGRARPRKPRGPRLRPQYRCRGDSEARGCTRTRWADLSGGDPQQPARTPAAALPGV
jgi:hypothetical protein